MALQGGERSKLWRGVIEFKYGVRDVGWNSKFMEGPLMGQTFRNVYIKDMISFRHLSFKMNNGE